MYLIQTTSKAVKHFNERQKTRTNTRDRYGSFANYTFPIHKLYQYQLSSFREYSSIVVVIVVGNIVFFALTVERE